MAEKTNNINLPLINTANSQDLQTKFIDFVKLICGVDEQSAFNILDKIIAAKADLVDGKVPASQLPSYVDDVLEINTLSNFPSKGESGKIYVAIDTNLAYRWTGSTYVAISQNLALGETSSSAYPGNKGKANAEAIEGLQLNKQDKLIPGENIIIKNNVISSVGGNEGVSEEEVLQIIEDNSQQVDVIELEQGEEMNIATSESFDMNSDSELVTTKAVIRIVESYFENGDEGSY